MLKSTFLFLSGQADGSRSVVYGNLGILSTPAQWRSAPGCAHSGAQPCRYAWLFLFDFPPAEQYCWLLLYFSFTFVYFFSVFLIENNCLWTAYRSARQATEVGPRRVSVHRLSSQAHYRIRGTASGYVAYFVQSCCTVHSYGKLSPFHSNLVRKFVFCSKSEISEQYHEI